MNAFAHTIAHRYSYYQTVVIKVSESLERKTRKELEHGNISVTYEKMQ